MRFDPSGGPREEGTSPPHTASTLGWRTGWGWGADVWVLATPRPQHVASDACRGTGLRHFLRLADEEAACLVTSASARSSRGAERGPTDSRAPAACWSRRGNGSRSRAGRSPDLKEFTSPLKDVLKKVPEWGIDSFFWPKFFCFLVWPPRLPFFRL